VRDIAELAGVDKTTASTATARLCAAGAVKLIQHSAYTFARRFELPDSRDLEKKTKFQTLPMPIREGVSEVSSFLIPEAFRARGLGRASYEALQHLGAGPLSVAELAERSGRHVQTIREALKRLKKHGLVAKQGKIWRGRALSDIDLDDLARAVSMKGAAAALRERHKADRLRHKLKRRLRQVEQSEQ
jgi:predicted transcriptional regulator